VGGGGESVSSSGASWSGDKMIGVAPESCTAGAVAGEGKVSARVVGGDGLGGRSCSLLSGSCTAHISIMNFIPI